MDNDTGWAAKEVTLVAHAEEHDHRHYLTLPCRWVELVQAWDGQEGAYFLVSGIEDGLLGEQLSAHIWDFVTFRDALGKAHRHQIRAVTQPTALSIRLTRGHYLSLPP